MAFLTRFSRRRYEDSQQCRELEDVFPKASERTPCRTEARESLYLIQMATMSEISYTQINRKENTYSKSTHTTKSIFNHSPYLNDKHLSNKLDCKENRIRTQSYIDPIEEHVFA